VSPAAERLRAACTGEWEWRQREFGPVPLPVLEERMARFIAEGGVNRPARGGR